jgi:hypothetical protein
MPEALRVNFIYPKLFVPGLLFETIRHKAGVTGPPQSWRDRSATNLGEIWSNLSPCIVLLKTTGIISDFPSELCGFNNFICLDFDGKYFTRYLDLLIAVYPNILHSANKLFEIIK